MDTSAALQKLGLAVLLGALVGLQREKDQPRIAGLRTFPLITGLGTLLGLLSPAGNPMLMVGGLIGLVALCYLGNWIAIKRGDLGSGITTEVAILVMYSVGALLTVTSEVVAIVSTGAVAVLLQFKPELHSFADRLKDNDVRAIMRLVIIAAIILPILPDKVIGPFEILNPFHLWKVVVLVVAINLSGYLLYRFVGEKAGTLLGGLFGGLISSTATTLSEAKLSSTNKNQAGRSTIVILIASAVMFVRVLVEIAAIAPPFLKIAAFPIGLMAAISFGTAGVAWLVWNRRSTTTAKPEKPEGMKAALVFGALYAIIGVGIALAHRHLGAEAVLWLSGLSGLTDVDAVTLSTSEMVKGGQIPHDTGWKMILLAALSNVVFKLGIVAYVGKGPLLKHVLPFFCASLLAGVLILALG